MTGGLDLAPPDAAESIDDYADSMTQVGVPFEWLDSIEIARRWPHWRLDDGTRGIFQADAGIADPERGNEAHQRLARAAGATLLDRTRVDRIRDHAGELEVVTDDGRSFTSGTVVLAADAWTNDLLEPLGHRLPLSVTREQVTWFEPRDAAAFDPARSPVWIWLDQPSFYGFPTYRGPGPKVGEDIGGRPTTAHGRSFDPDLDCLDRVSTFLGARMPDAVGRAVRTKTCLYTLTPDRDFVLDRVPDHPGVIVALGAAHAYKFAALFGSLIAGLAADRGGTAPGASAALFSISRPALASPATNLAATS